MMGQIEKKFNRMYLRGMILHFDEEAKLDQEISKFWKRRVIEYSEISLRPNYLFFMKLPSDNPPPAYLSENVKYKNGRYVYDVCGFVINKNKFKAIIIAAPSKNVLSDFHPSNHNQFAVIDLEKICHNAYNGNLKSYIAMSRINLKIAEKGNFVSSASFYGTNVFSSDIIKDVVLDAKLEDIDYEVEWSPFHINNSEMQTKRGLGVNSVRLTWDDGGDDGLSINVDKFGNLSFYIKSSTKFEQMNNLIEYLEDNKMLIGDVKSDPLTRDETALKLAEK